MSSATSPSAPPRGRVQARRQARLDEIVDAAIEVMAETGAAGLSLGEVARRIGIRTPSLYEHVDSRAALCDEIFRRGWTQFAAVTADVRITADTDLAALLLTQMRAGLTWALGHRAHAELMFWRPIPGWQPSAEAFAPAADTLAKATRVFTEAQDAGLLRTDVPVDELVQTWVTLTAGLISQQLANEPDAPIEQGRASRYLESLVTMFIHHYRTREGS